MWNILLKIHCFTFGFQRKGRQKQKRRCRALYDCNADNEDELSFQEGEVIIIDREEEDDWWVSSASCQVVTSGVGL